MELCVITVLATEAQTPFPPNSQRQLNKTQMVCFIQPGAGTRGKKMVTPSALASRKMRREGLKTKGMLKLTIKTFNL